MKRNFKDKVMIVTGASGHLGKAICRQFAKEGCRIVALDIDPKALDRMQEELTKEGLEILPILCDITDRNSCQAASKTVLKKWGQIDGLVNNAGITHIERFAKMNRANEITRQIMEVNFFGAVNCTEVVLEQLVKNQGVIINISSVAGFAPLLGRTAYAASKHALHGFFESLGCELQEEGVHCLMVCPSFIEGPAEGVEAASEKKSIYQNKKTIGKTISVEEIARAIYSYCINNKKLLVVGKIGKQSYLMRRFFPSIYERIMIKNLKKDL